MFRNFVVAAGLLAATSVCFAQTPVAAGTPAATVTVLPNTDLPLPNRADLLGERAFYIGPLDVLIIDVFGIEDFKAREIQVDISGRIAFPLAGTIKVAGMTPGEVRTELERRLRDKFVRNPQVTVNLKEIQSQLVTVEGQVRRPGQYPVTGRMTLLRAVARAEGTDEFAKLSEVVIFRTVQGRDYAALYNLKAIRRGTYADPEVYANDIVVVGESKGRRLFKDLVGIVPALTTPLVVLLQK